MRDTRTGVPYGGVRSPSLPNRSWLPVWFTDGDPNPQKKEDGPCGTVLNLVSHEVSNKRPRLGHQSYKRVIESRPQAEELDVKNQKKLLEAEQQLRVAAQRRKLLEGMAATYYKEWKVVWRQIDIALEDELKIVRKALKALAAQERLDAAYALLYKVLTSRRETQRYYISKAQRVLRTYLSGQDYFWPNMAAINALLTQGKAIPQWRVEKMANAAILEFRRYHYSQRWLDI